MRKFLSLIVALAVTAALFIFLTLPEHERQSVRIARVIDGDTFVGSDGATYRLSNINTPETGTSGADEAAEYLRLLEGKDVEVEIRGVDKYGRTLARLYAPEYVNRELVASGLAVKFLVDEQETEAFAAAETKAIVEQRGIWKHSLNFGCVRANVDETQEVVVLSSTCGALNITGWTLRDESRKAYVFEEKKLTTLVVYTHNGIDNATAVFWNSATPIWNNERDTLYLLDTEGRIVHYAAHGY